MTMMAGLALSAIAAVASADSKSDAVAKKAAAAKRAEAAAKAVVAVKGFKAALKGAGPEDIRAHMKRLAAIGHEKVLPVLGRILLGSDQVLAEGAAEDIVSVGQALDGRRKALAVRTLLPGLRRAMKLPELGVACIKALAAIGDASAVRPLIGLIHHKQPIVAKAAIESFKAFRRREAIAPIIDELVKVRSGSRGGGGFMSGGTGAGSMGGMGGGSSAPSDTGGTGGWAGGNAGTGASGAGQRAMQRVQLVQEAGFSTLQALTGEPYRDAMLWKAWWRKNGKRFRLKKAEAKAAGN
jgi:hypothetical protein